jgi:hypothetical protein
MLVPYVEVFDALHSFIFVLAVEQKAVFFQSLTDGKEPIDKLLAQSRNFLSFVVVDEELIVVVSTDFHDFLLRVVVTDAAWLF